VLVDPRTWVEVADAKAAFVWTVDPPMTLSEPAALTGKEAEPTIANKGLVVEPPNAKKTAEVAAEVAAAEAAAKAAKAAKETKTETAKTETKTDAAATPAETAPPAGPGACGASDKCDTGEGAAKIYCSAEKLASGILSAIVVVSMM